MLSTATPAAVNWAVYPKLLQQDLAVSQFPNINGSGLRGLQERISEAGGTVEAGPIDSGGFRLAVNLPR